MGNTFDWRSKIHDTIDEFEKIRLPEENPCGEIMASGVKDQTMQPMQSKPQLNNVVKELLHHVVDLFASDDLIDALEDAVTFFEADERVSESYAEGFLGIEDGSLYIPDTVLEDTYLPSHGDLTWFPPSPPAPLTSTGKHYFEVRMPDFEIETIELTKPSVELTIPDGWVSFNITFDGDFNYSIGKEPEDTTPEGILFSKIED